MKWLIMLVLLSAVTAALAKGEGLRQESKAQRDARMKWWREARFGMFIHWGLYSVPAGKWKDRTNHGEWIRETAHIPIAEYEPFLQQFNPIAFDAKEWVRMAEDAGMKYLVITSKHHDGFNLFDSPFTTWDVMATPFKRDILKELSAACQGTDVRFCTYHSIMDWYHPDYLPKRAWEGETWRQATHYGDLTNHKPDFGRFNTFLQNEVRHIIEHYHPGVMWFDGEWEATWNHDWGQALYDVCLKADPKIIVNNRVDVGRGGMAGMSDAGYAGDFGTPEQEIPAQGIPGVDWESCMTMNGNWGYNAWDKNFKSTTELIHNLVDIVSKGGNYLLNIGPRADGTFPPESVERLREIGKWMHVNSESIYATHASPFKSLPWGRATMKPGAKQSTIYLQVFDWPKDGKLVVPGLGNDPIEAQILGSQTLSDVRRSGADLVIDVRHTMPSPHCGVVKLMIAGSPIVYETPTIVADSQILVDALSVSVETGSKDLDIRYTTDGTNPSASSKRVSGPIRIAGTTTVKAQAYHKGKPVSGVAARTFEKVAPWASQALEVPRPEGLQREVFKGDWNKCPDWDRLKAESVVGGKAIGLDEFKSTEFVGMRFTGYVNVPADGVYLFSLLSDDGSKLSIDGKVIVDHDGPHSPSEKAGVAPLAKGFHKITVEWFNKSGGAALELKWAKVGNPLQPIPLASLVR